MHLDKIKSYYVLLESRLLGESGPILNGHHIKAKERIVPAFAKTN